jgi:hypothetical protein
LKLFYGYFLSIDIIGCISILIYRELSHRGIDLGDEMGAGRFQAHEETQLG